MFDLGFSELIVIAIVLLVVVGPERLPRVARVAGHLFGRAQRYVSDLKTDIQREIQIDDLKKLQQQTQDLDRSLREEMGGLQSSVRDALSLETGPAAQEKAVLGVPSEENTDAPGENAGVDTLESQLRLDLDSLAPPPPVSPKPLDTV